MSGAGTLITDGTCIWIVDDVRDGSRVGDIIIRPTLRDGFVKANGAVLKASEYPRLLHYVQDNSLIITAAEYKSDCSKYVYDATADTLIIPNMTGRVLQGGDTLKSIEAGLPNITGDLGSYNVRQFHNENSILPTGAFSGATTTGVERTAGSNTNGGNWSGFDASKSNAIYGASNTVQPPALQMIAQIKY